MSRFNIGWLAVVVLSVVPRFVAAGSSDLPCPVVFVARAIDPNLKDAAIPGAILSAVRQAAWGKLQVFEMDGTVRTILDGENAPASGSVPRDYLDPDVSYDGKRILFSGLRDAPNDPANGYRIFEVDADGSGLRQITRSDRSIDLSRHGAAASELESYDDLDPCYLPDGRICFVSTRYPGVAPDTRARSTNLYVMDADGSDLHRITTERFGADTPAVDPQTGQIVYSRWWRTAQSVNPKTGLLPPSVPPGSPGYGNPNPGPVTGNPSQTDVLAAITSVPLTGIDGDAFPGLNSWFLAGINPDGTGLAMFSGFHLDREATQAYRPAFLPDGTVVGLFIPRTPILGRPGANGLRLYPRGMGRATALSGPQTFTQDATLPPSGDGTLYSGAAALPDGRIIASATFGFGSSLHALVVKGIKDKTTTVALRQPGLSALDPAPLAPRAKPPVIADSSTDRLQDEVPATLEEAYARGGSFTFQVENIHANAPVDVPMADAPPVGRRLFIEFYTSPQRTGSLGSTGLLAADEPILIHRTEIGPGGKATAELPGGVPLFEVLRRSDGTIAVGRDGQIFHVGGFNFGQAGKTARCVGCHAGHSTMAVPEEGADASWTNLGPSAEVSAPGFQIFPGILLRPEAFVDRSTLAAANVWTGSDPSSPKANETPRVRLHYTGRIRAQKLVLHGPAEAAQGPDPKNQAFSWIIRASTFAAGAVQEEVQTPAPLALEVLPRDGVSLPLDPTKDFDTVEVSLSAVNRLTGTPAPAAFLPGLSEIEVIAQPVIGNYLSVLSFARGDSNCDGLVNVSDAIAILRTLFDAGGALCCAAGADANDDATVTVSDAIYLLSYSFDGGDPPAAPFPGCGSVPEGALSCDFDCR